mgnify:CR=1 FL=1
MFESTNTTSATGVAPFDLHEHLIDVSRGEGVARRTSNDLEFLAAVGFRLPLADFAQRLPHPLGDGHPAGLGECPNFSPLVLWQQDLQSNTHAC